MPHRDIASEKTLGARIEAGLPVRVYHIAKAAGVLSRVVVEFFRRNNVASIKTPSSRVESALALAVVAYLKHPHLIKMDDAILLDNEVRVEELETRFVRNMVSSLRHGCAAWLVLDSITTYVEGNPRRVR